MTITEQRSRIDFELVAFDLYRDIHKGIRAELFAVTGEAGRIDPADRAARTALADHVRTLKTLLVTHAEHEDHAVQPAIELHVPAVAERIVVDHAVIDGRLDTLEEMAVGAVDATRSAQAGLVRRLYLELASFTAAYLEHQDLEERVVMPALFDAIGFEATLAIHQSIITSLTPEETAMSLAVMIPAMNVDDRTELLGGMRASAPAEVFEGVWGLAGSVLAPVEMDELAARLGIG